MENKHEFAVSLRPVFTVAPLTEIRGKKAVVREDSNETLGIVSDAYGLLSHKTVVDAFRTALTGYKVTEKIQLAKGGARLFATYRLDDIKIAVRPGDECTLQFVVKNSYDGSHALQIMLGAYRLVCSNGMMVGKDFFSFSVKHIGSRAVNEIGAATTVSSETIRAKVEDLIAQFKEILPALQRMATTQMPLPKESLFDTEKIKKLPAYLLELARAEYEKEKDTSRWGYYNALTHAITHGMKRNSPNATVAYGKVAWGLATRYTEA